MSDRLSQLERQELAAWPTDVRPHVSASSIKTFLRCPEQYRQRYVLDRKERPNSRLIFGSAHHDVVELNMKAKVNTYNDLPLKDLQLRFAESVDERIDRDGGEAEVEWETGDKALITDKAKAIDIGVRLVGVWREQAAKRVQPTAVEREFSRQFDGFPVPLTGRIDVEAALVEPFVELPKRIESETCRMCDDDLLVYGLYVQERGLCPLCAGDHIIESKTANQKRVPNDLEIQVAMYQLDRPLPVVAQLAVKKKQPEVFEKVYPQRSRQRSLMILRRAMTEIGHCVGVYGIDQPWPYALHQTGNVCGYCGFGPNAANICPWWNDNAWKGGV